MVYTLKKVSYRIARYIYVLSKSPLKSWIKLLFKKSSKILFEAIIIQYSVYDRSASLFSGEYVAPQERLIGNEDYEKDILPKVKNR
ncbi:MAG: hypothetical protein LBK94_08210 [Prevotellaceae bacterium]|jgi:hypothetical protein|nr:hypothetical protein [Prevotellaceae bacterium]